LTTSVRELEKELGITIFSRSGRGTTLTSDGEEFIRYARDVFVQYERLNEKYVKKENIKKKFGISTQHYSFAIKSFVEMVKEFDTEEYEFAIRETKTQTVIDDVSTGKSEIGILYLNDFNRQAIEKLLRSNDLAFKKLVDCSAYVYIWKGHPLAKNEYIRFEELKDYPCLSFEQGASGSFYFAEEILSTYEYSRTIKATDRATMLNLMVGLNGYTLCSGIICEELNGSDYVAVPFKPDKQTVGDKMEIGYIYKKNIIPSKMAELYVENLTEYLNNRDK